MNHHALLTGFGQIGQIDDPICYGPYIGYNNPQRRGVHRCLRCVTWILRKLYELVHFLATPVRRSRRSRRTDYGPVFDRRMGIVSIFNTTTNWSKRRRNEESSSKVRWIKEQSAKTRPFVATTVMDDPKAASARNAFLDMLQTSTSVIVPVTSLPHGKSQPPNPRHGGATTSPSPRLPRPNKHAKNLVEFLSAFPPDEYIQQEPLSELVAPSKENYAVVQHLHEQLFVNSLGTCLSPAYRHLRTTDVHGPNLFAGPSDIHVSLHFDRYNTADNNNNGGGWSSSSSSSEAFRTDPGRHNLFHQMSGSKLWILFPPIPDHEEERRVFRPLTRSGLHFHVSAVLTDCVSSTKEESGVGTQPLLRRDDYPEFCDSAWKQRIEVLLLAGQSLHIPPRWWHTTKSLEAGIAVNWWFTME